MVSVRFIAASGQEDVVDIDDGISVMEGAVRAGVEGIDADCGGQLTCATCHVHVAREWLGKLGERSDSEDALLEFAIGVDDCSRLSCQIVVTPDLDGIVFHIPEAQS